MARRKDFVDLYFVCREAISLDEVLRLFEQKFGTVRYERYHLLKSLRYFEDAESEVMPELIRPAAWPELEGFFKNEAARCFRSE